MYLLYVVLLIKGLYVNVISANERHWLSDISYANPDNWNLKRVPCEVDTVVFPEVMEFAVELAPKTAAKELVLPSTGTVFMSYTSSFALKDKHFESSSCTGKDIEFKKFESMYWVDAKNWDGWNKATPHTDRIPCQTDSVVFPNEGTFSVTMPWQTIQVAALTLNGEEMDTVSWWDFSRSEVGLQQFSKTNYNPGEIEIISAPASCNSIGCMCSNEYLEESICERVRPCEATNCFRPVRPKGFCCQICGAVLSYHFTRDFRMPGMKLVIADAVKEHGWAVTWYVSRYEATIQLVLVERNQYSGEVDGISAKLNDILVKSSLGLQSASIHSSGPVYYKTPIGQYLQRFFLTMFAALLLMAGIFIYYYNATAIAVRRTVSSGQRPFLFARFENQSGSMRLRQSQQSLSVVSLPQAFDNPMYGTTAQTARDITVENPIYTELIKEEEGEEGGGGGAEEITETDMIDETPKEKEELMLDT